MDNKCALNARMMSTRDQYNGQNKLALTTVISYSPWNRQLSSSVQQRQQTSARMNTAKIALISSNSSSNSGVPISVRNCTIAWHQKVIGGMSMLFTGASMQRQCKTENHVVYIRQWLHSSWSRSTVYVGITGRWQKICKSHNFQLQMHDFMSLDTDGLFGYY